jgi:hypothetical protein
MTYRILCGLAGLVLSSPLALSDTRFPTPNTTAPTVERETRMLGSKFGVTISTVANAAESGSATRIAATILGKKKSLVQAIVSASPDLSQGTRQTYVNGLQLGSLLGAIEQRDWNRKLTIPPLNINGTIVSIPIGPVEIAVKGGDALTGELDADLTLGSGQEVKATLDADVQSSGFVDGSVKLFVVRGGVGGQVEVVDGRFESKVDLALGQAPPVYYAQGKISALSGSVSAYADYYRLFGGWKRFWNAMLYGWGGLCYDFDTRTQVGGKCALP